MRDVREIVRQKYGAAALKVSRRAVLSDPAADALRLSCALLETPVLPELERHYSGAHALPKPA